MFSHISVNLYVDQLPNDEPEWRGVATYRLLVCPSLPLYNGIKVRLFAVLDPPEVTPFVPIQLRRKIVACKAGFEGVVRGACSRDENEVVFMVDNQVDDAEVQRAYIRVPCVPGISVALIQHEREQVEETGNRIRMRRNGTDYY